ncbi:proline-rich proteoglycan 2-like [Homarus americanus]|uniref:proline-rich proteoglycan 2-like n=1 Tax=Homarus americanus TaxID=6706 RepID=UPI001C48E3E5|nr:proline-rich proteoglycan 2-like [Homarus americanus]
MQQQAGGRHRGFQGSIRARGPMGLPRVLSEFTSGARAPMGLQREPLEPSRAPWTCQRPPQEPHQSPGHMGLPGTSRVPIRPQDRMGVLGAPPEAPPEPWGPRDRPLWESPPLGGPQGAITLLGESLAAPPALGGPFGAPPALGAPLDRRHLLEGPRRP